MKKNILWICFITIIFGLGVYVIESSRTDNYGQGRVEKVFTTDEEGNIIEVVE